MYRSCCGVHTLNIVHMNEWKKEEKGFNFEFSDVCTMARYIVEYMLNIASSTSKQTISPYATVHMAIASAENRFLIKY